MACNQVLSVNHHLPGFICSPARAHTHTHMHLSVVIQTLQGDLVGIV